MILATYYWVCGGGLAACAGGLAVVAVAVVEEGWGLWRSRAGLWRGLWRGLGRRPARLRSWGSWGAGGHPGIPGTPGTAGTPGNMPGKYPPAMAAAWSCW